MNQLNALETILSPKYFAIGDIKISFIDYKLLVTLSDLHQEYCMASRFPSSEINEQIDESLTRILKVYREDVKSALFSHYGASWEYPRVDAIEVDFEDDTKTWYLLDRRDDSFTNSGNRLKRISDDIQEKLQE